MRGIVVLIACFYLCVVLGLENGLARLPPMGWMTWERFRCITDCKKYPTGKFLNWIERIELIIIIYINTSVTIAFKNAFQKI